MKQPGAVRVYKALVVLYPRSFRREYSDDMTSLFAEQLRDEAALRVCARASVDLLLTVPARYLEVVMPRSSGFVTLFSAALAVAGLVCAVLVGTNPALAFSGAFVALAAGGLSFVSYRRSRPLAPQHSTGTWWKLASAGGVMLVALIVTVNLTGEVPSGFWLPMVITGLTAILLVAMGLLLGLAQIATGGSRRTSAS